MTSKHAIRGLGKSTILVLAAFGAARAADGPESEGGNKLLSTTIGTVSLPKTNDCAECHKVASPGIVDHWKGSGHFEKNVGCLECHQAQKGDADGFDHYGSHIATVVTPTDCGACHEKEFNEFTHSHHAKAANILASLDNVLAETAEGYRGVFNPHSPARTPGGPVDKVNGFASAALGCKQCHGSKMALQGTDGSMITVDDLKPGVDGKPTNTQALAKIARNAEGKPMFHPNTWPNTGIGRINLDGSLGSCTACHSRHDFSRRRARQPEGCGRCHMGPDHPQKEIFEESKHGIAYRDLREHMNLDSGTWVLGEDYSQAPTCATCHMSANMRNGGKVTHDPGERISWTNRPPVSQIMDTDKEHRVVTENDPEKRKTLVIDTAENKRNRMKEVCLHCHSTEYVDGFYKQYDDLVVLYNEKFAKPGQAIVAEMRKQNLLTPTDFDEEIEWSWYLLWHHEGRRARMGASMMGPDYTHWHGMFEVAERFYQEFIPQAREIVHRAEKAGKSKEAAAVKAVIDNILSRPENSWRKWEDVKGSE
ncbi:MAG: multiheme c-type cytochrome [Planctomycetota bacterium]